MGNSLPIPYPQRPHQDEAIDEGIVHLSRLGPELDTCFSPIDMTIEEIEAKYRKIYTDQHRENPPDTFYQFAVRRSRSQVFDTVTAAHPETSFRYGPHSWLFTARLLCRDPQDDIACAEITEQLPVICEFTTTYHPFPNLEDLLARVRNVPNLERLLRLASDYETMAPIAALRRIWRSWWQYVPWLPEEPPAVDSGIDYLGGWMLPDDYNVWEHSDDDNDWTMLCLFEWMQSGSLFHSYTGVLLSGPYGFKWPTYILIRVEHALASMTLTTKEKWGALGKSIKAEREIISNTAGWLCEEIVSSAKTLRDLRQQNLPRLQRIEVVPDWQRAWHHIGPQLNENSELLIADELSSIGSDWEVEEEEAIEDSEHQVLTVPKSPSGKAVAGSRQAKPGNTKSQQKMQVTVEIITQNKADLGKGPQDPTTKSDSATDSHDDTIIPAPKFAADPTTPVEATEPSGTQEAQVGCIRAFSEHPWKALQDCIEAINELNMVVDLYTRGQLPSRELILHHMPAFTDPIIQALSSITGANIIFEVRVMLTDRDATAFTTCDALTQSFINSRDGEARQITFTEWFKGTLVNGESDQLPLFSCNAVYQPFPPELQPLLEHLSNQNTPSLGKMVQACIAYEQLGPPMNGHGILNINHPHTFTVPEGLPTFYEDEMRLDTNNHDRASPPFISSWIQSNPFIHAPTGVVLGGPGGIRLGAFMVLWMAVTVVTIQRKLPDYNKNDNCYTLKQMLMLIERGAKNIIEQIGTSSAALENTWQQCEVDNPRNISFVELRPHDHPERIRSPHAARVECVGGLDILSSSQITADPRTKGKEPDRDQRETTLDPEITLHWGTTDDHPERLTESADLLQEESGAAQDDEASIKVRDQSNIHQAVKHSGMKSVKAQPSTSAVHM
ncbi:hypothetical protein FRC11_001626 [Ceratobasidium sp. 423]|nr:hypothetical protein FRC11_001626 [Ceratobasidium sp. 423]